MHKKQKALDVLMEQKLLPLFYHDSVQTSADVLRALFDAGIKIVEYTNRGENALENFMQLREAIHKNMPGLLLGIGTIKTKKQAKKFMEAGADFIVCPTVNEEVGEAVSKEDLLWIPGGMTPTEISVAEQAGAELVKIFPGNILGPAFISAVKELFPGMKFMPTGGVEVEENNLRGWYSSGVIGVGMGSKLLPKELINKKDFNAIREGARNALALVKSVSVS
jgi:2-dehydro-3-deoxyphosphogluconate aldolase/(4S)-4-hydroxy-2-oxoglutarate aldolase